MLTFDHLVAGFDGHGTHRTFAEVPEQCPVCHHHIDPRRLTAHATVPDGTRIDFTFQCPRAACRRVFVGRYLQGLDGELDLVAVGAPMTPRAGETPPEIRAFALL